MASQMTRSKPIEPARWPAPFPVMLRRPCVWAITRSSGRLAAAAWAWCTVPGTRSFAEWWRSRCCWATTLPTEINVLRFRAEAEAVARLQHPHIVQLFEIGEHRGETGPPCPYLCFEYVDGGNLAQRLTGPLPAPAQAAAWLQTLAGAAHAAHGQGIIHRDLKPANVLLSRDGIPKICDFGVAKLTTGSDLKTLSGMLVGTAEYMAPEQAEGKRAATPATDVYALGAILYEMLTGRPPFRGMSNLDTLNLVRQVEPVPPRRLQPGLPIDLETICLKCLEKEGTRRYPSAMALADDLARFRKGESIQARRQTQRERDVRWARHHPATAVLGVVLTAVLVLASVASLLAAGYFKEAAQREHQARQEAEEAGDLARRRGDAERWERYRSNIAAAAGSLQIQNIGSARSALDAAPQEHRNWEWQYYHSQLDGARLVLSVPGGRILSIVLSPSGRQIAVCCLDHNEAYLYDVATGRLDAVLSGHSAPVTSLAYRPDGKQVASSGNDQTIRLWDPATGRQSALLRPETAPSNGERAPFVVYNSDGSRIASTAGLGLGDTQYAPAGTSRLWDAVTAKEIAVLAKWQERGRPVAFSPDGKRVAVGSREFVHLCDAITGRSLAVLGPHSKPVASLAYSPDGKRIASTTAVGASAVHLWDGESGKEVAVLRGHTDMVTSVLFSPDGSRLVSGCEYPDNTARLWDAATGGLLAVLAGHKNSIITVAFSPDGNQVATGSRDQEARLWDGRTGGPLAVLGGNTEFVRNVLFSPDGTRVVAASLDGTLRLWKARTGELIGVLRGHGDRFRCEPVFTPDGSRLVSGSTDGTVRIWATSLEERNDILRGHESFVYDVAFSPSGDQVASAAWDGTARLWDATNGTQMGLLKHETRMIYSVAYSRDGRRLATAAAERGVKLWDVATQKARDSWFGAAGFKVECRASLNPAGTLLAASSPEGPVRLWDVATGQQIAQLEGHDQCSNDVAFHPDGNLLATTGADGTVRLWDVATAAPVAVLRGHTDIVWRVDWSGDGKLLASCSNDKTICLWDTRTQERLAVIRLGSVVYGVAFSPNGMRLAAGCRDNTVRLVDVARRQEVGELRGHTDYVHAVAWSPDGTRVVSGSGDFTVRIWDSLSPAERAKRPAAEGVNANK